MFIRIIRLVCGLGGSLAIAFSRCSWFLDDASARLHIVVIVGYSFLVRSYICR